MAYVFDYAVPTPAGVYVGFSLGAVVFTGLGAALIAAGNGFEPVQVTELGLGWAFIAAVNSSGLSLYLKDMERIALDELRAATERKLYPDLNQKQQETYAPSPQIINTPKGPGYIDPLGKGFIMLKNLKRGFGKKNPAYAQQAEIIGKVIVQDKDTGTGGDFVNVSAGMWRLARYGGADPNKSMSEGEWTGADKPFSLDEFRALRDYMIDEGLARWKNERAHAQGWTIRPRARAILRGFEQMKVCPPPISDTPTRE